MTKLNLPIIIPSLPSIKGQVIKAVSELTKRINRKIDSPDKLYRLKIIKQELSKLADEL